MIQKTDRLRRREIKFQGRYGGVIFVYDDVLMVKMTEIDHLGVLLPLRPLRVKGGLGVDFRKLWKITTGGFHKKLMSIF